jgi:hypothetical protein
MTEQKADMIGKGIFLIGLGLLFILNAWWPWLLLVILASLGVRHLLLKKYWELTLTAIVFIFLFVVAIFHFEEMYLIPALLILGGTYFIVREFFFDSSEGKKDA